MIRERHMPWQRVVTLFSTILLVVPTIGVLPAAAAGPCFCYGEDNTVSGCYPAASQALCDNVNVDVLRQAGFEKCSWQTNNSGCEKAFADWKIKQEQGKIPTAAAASKSAFIPECVLENKLDLNGPCGDVSIFVLLLLNASNYLFSIIGAVALAVFVYGGFLLIVSQGNEEKITKGMDAIKAAIIGLAVAFGGYFLIRFLGQAIGIKSTFGL